MSHREATEQERGRQSDNNEASSFSRRRGRHSFEVSVLILNGKMMSRERSIIREVKERRKNQELRNNSEKKEVSELETVKQRNRQFQRWIEQVSNKNSQSHKQKQKRFHCPHDQHLHSLARSHCCDQLLFLLLSLLSVMSIIFFFLLQLLLYSSAC